MTGSLVDLVVELAKEVDKEDPIDFGMVAFSEEISYRIVASTLIENIGNLKTKDEMIVAMAATATHLMVENMVLNKRLLDQP